MAFNFILKALLIGSDTGYAIAPFTPRIGPTLQSLGPLQSHFFATIEATDKVSNKRYF